MPQYRIRGTFANGQPAILRINADNPYAAVAAAAQEVKEAGVNLAQIQQLSVKTLGNAKTRVHIGTVPSRKGVARGTRKAPTAPAPTQAPAPTPEPTQAPVPPMAEPAPFPTTTPVELPSMDPSDQPQVPVSGSRRSASKAGSR